jgi:hypothetical protein
LIPDAFANIAAPTTVDHPHEVANTLYFSLTTLAVVAGETDRGAELPLEHVPSSRHPIRRERPAASG